MLCSSLLRKRARYHYKRYVFLLFSIESATFEGNVHASLTLILLSNQNMHAVGRIEHLRLLCSKQRLVFVFPGYAGEIAMKILTQELVLGIHRQSKGNSAALSFFRCLSLARSLSLSLSLYLSFSGGRASRRLGAASDSPPLTSPQE